MGKDRKGYQRTYCGRMDHGGCSLLVKVEMGKVVEILPDGEGPLSRGYICPKGLASKEKLNHPERLKRPLLRKGPKGRPEWEEISWDKALDIIEERFLGFREKFGPESVAFCHGMPKGLDLFVMIRLANLFGSPNVVMVQDVCHAPREIAGLHTCGFYPVADLKGPARALILWGSNLSGTNEEGQVFRLLSERLKEGARLIVVDPILHRSYKDRLDIFLPVNPGSDLALALGMINVIISKELYDKEFVTKWCHGFQELKEHVRGYVPEKVSPIVGIPPELIQQAAITYATTKPAAIVWGNAIEQIPHNFPTIRSLIILMAITGNLDIAGGNIQPGEPNILRPGEFVKSRLFPEKTKKMLNSYYGTIPRLMTVPPAYFRKAVIEGKPYKVVGAYFQATNPLITWADSRLTEEALLKLDFVVLSDVYLTPTALYADIVLPAATQFEFNDIGHYGLGHGFILARPKLVEPPPHCWPDIKILNELGRRITDPKYWYEDYEDLLKEILGPAGLTLEEFMEVGILEGKMDYQKYKKGGFKTPTGKVELYLSRAEELGVSPLPEYKPVVPSDSNYQLSMTSMKEPLFLHSSYRWVPSLRKLVTYPKALLSPKTADLYGVKEGDEIIIETPYGSITHILEINPDLKDDVVIVKHGWWYPEVGSKEGYHWKKSNINMLTSINILGKEFGTPNLRGIKCKIRKLD